MSKLLDTNTLLNGAEAGILTYPVLEELDRLKTREGLPGKQARDAVKYIYRNLDKFVFIDDLLENNETVDDFLIRVAEKEEMILVTYDLSLYLKALSKGIDADFGLEENSNYSGTTYLTEEEYLNPNLVLDKELPENHYLFHKEEVFIIEDGQIEQVESQIIHNSFTQTIYARNPEQTAFMHSLNSDIPVMLITGGYGCGKSWLTLNYALSELEQGKINKIVVIPNNSFVSDSREIAALPGDLFDKELMHMGPLIDLVGVDQLARYWQKGEIEILPISVARGRNLENSFVW